MIKKILIIGGNGFLGFNTAKNLAKKGYKLVLICKKKINKRILLRNLKYKYCDIRKFKKLKSTLINEDYDCVINFSGNINHKSNF